MKNNHIQYIEMYATDLEVIKSFYSETFGWSFTDYGEGYTAFDDSGVFGGFEKVTEVSQGGALIILYHTDLRVAEEAIVKNGGTISKGIFSFPGGRRFHFRDPSGNELAVWSDAE